ncbi:unnamed protein product [Spirodela intermedia]|uniref:Uncharacterized protein n=1 Tax=Spirodela intermedia TaxID=51605 RepID=A0A7I8IZ12_SPIIN|nr:unnamed protein product [Spirodela intermedia]CAA6662823.1 unnamed protein product [Spirodela intermedia]
MPAFKELMGVVSPRLLSSVIRKRSRNRKKKKKTKTKTKAQEINPGAAADEDPEGGIDSAVEMEEEAGGFDLKSSSSSLSHAIQPLGNLLLAGDPSANIRHRGLGSLFVLSDELLLDVLSLLPAGDLARLAAVSKSLYVFSTHDPLWRNLVLEDLRGDFLFTSSWRSTYGSAAAGFMSPGGPAVRIRDFYSDYLFQSWLCASMEMKPEWLRTENIKRRRGISVEEFVSCFEEPNIPVLLEGCMEDWPAASQWDHAGLVGICKGAKFAVGPVEMDMESYFQYGGAAREERPLYLFDPKFADKYFREDLFSVLGDERPDYRWIIVGPAGSGSSFHVDPNSTSAWNAVIKGSKKWVMFPPEVAPPGVHPSADGSEVACPVSIMEWFMNFYGACRDWPKRPVECVCRAGEIVFVPNGWWHLVINLEDSVAITQNYVSRRNLLNVLDFLRRPNAKELVSGTEDRVNLYEKFRCAVESYFPGLIDELRKKAEGKMAEEKKMTFWESVSDANTGGFKFSF